MHLFDTLILFFKRNEYTENLVEYNIDKVLNLMSDEDKKREDYQFIFECLPCHNLAFNSFSGNVTLEQKLNTKYRNSSLAFCIKESLSNIGDSNHSPLKLNNDFFRNFQDIRYLGVVDYKVMIEDGNCFSDSKLIGVQLENNQIDILPISLFNITSMQRLWIANNSVKTFLDEAKAKNIKIKNIFKNLENLKSLWLENLLIDDKSLFKNSPQTIDDLIRLPKKLKKLTIIGLSLSYLPFDLSKSKKELKELVFSGVKWINLANFTNGSTVSIYQETLIPHLEKLFKKTQIIKIFQFFDSNGKGYLNREDALKLNAFIFNRFLRLGTPTEYLDLFGEYEISGIPAQIFELTNLSSLDLSYQGIKYIPDSISELQNLVNLLLNDCILLEKISDQLSKLKLLKTLNINNCISLKTPPPEICKRGFNSIMSYLKRLTAGSVQCKRTKLMLVI